jgi:hypothetical protein
VYSPLAKIKIAPTALLKFKFETEQNGENTNKVSGNSANASTIAATQCLK